jgi:hypothetical protein
VQRGMIVNTFKPPCKPGLIRRDRLRRDENFSHPLESLFTRSTESHLCSATPGTVLPVY